MFVTICHCPERPYDQMQNQQLSEIISVYFYRQIWLIFQNIDIIYKTIPVIGGLWFHEVVSILSFAWRVMRNDNNSNTLFV